MNSPNQRHASATSHLSDEALDDLLIGASQACDTAHLAACEACAARLAEFRSALAFFNQASATWSKARSNTISRVLVPRRSTSGVTAAWSFASAAVLSVALTFMVGVHHESPSPMQAVTEQTATLDQEIASDNAMLHAIDSELSSPVPSPVEVSAVQKADTSMTRQNTSREVRD